MNKRAEWQPDIDQSVADYDEWYLAESPSMFAIARGRAVAEVEAAMQITDDFRTFTPQSLIARPSILLVARMCISPSMARDRFVGFSGVTKSLVNSMERKGVIPPRARRLEMQLPIMCDFLLPLFDPGIFPWLAEDRKPTTRARDDAILVVGDRLANALHMTDLRNAQEARQKVLMRAYLEASGFDESTYPPFQMLPGTFQFGRDVSVVREDGARQSMPIDCVVAPLEASLPLACIEMKSAGDYTNVNKRRKEESDKNNALKRAHDTSAVFLLQLFGYFGHTYLAFEAASGIDWAWDHRLSDLDSHLGIA